LPDGQEAAGFEQDRSPLVGECRHQLERFALKQRFAAGQFDERTVERQGPVEHLRESLDRPLPEGVRGIAPGTPGGARGEPDEDAGEPGEGRFALDAPVNLMDEQMARRLAAQRCESLVHRQVQVHLHHLWVRTSLPRSQVAADTSAETACVKQLIPRALANLETDSERQFSDEMSQGNTLGRS